MQNRRTLAGDVAANKPVCVQLVLHGMLRRLIVVYTCAQLFETASKLGAAQASGDPRDGALMKAEITSDMQRIIVECALALAEPDSCVLSESAHASSHLSVDAHLGLCLLLVWAMSVTRGAGQQSSCRASRRFRVYKTISSPSRRLCPCR
jgi:hypothetical protein